MKKPFLISICILSAMVVLGMADVNYVPDMITVRGGTFQMGNTRGDSEGFYWDKPVHTVKLTYDYYIGKYEVTFNEYDAYCDASGKEKFTDYNNLAGYHMGRGNKPVINVNWYDAIAFCNWLSKKEGLQPAYSCNGKLLDANGQITTDITQVEGYRLPTESEWEYAARGGHIDIVDGVEANDYKYTGSNNIDEVGWYRKNSGDRILAETDNDLDEVKIKANNCKTQVVGQKNSNELGLYDMSGNVWEWCHDWYDIYATDTTQTNPIGADIALVRILRGGDYFSEVKYVQVSHRYYYYPDVSRGLGFRVARTQK